MSQHNSRLQLHLKDKRWRMRNLYKIRTKDENLAVLRLNDEQRMLEADPSKLKVILKSRQIGISTYNLIDIFDDVVFNPYKNAVILAHEQDAIEKLFRIIRTAHSEMPIECKPDPDRGGGSKHELYFPVNKSRISVDLESRGDTITDLHISEMAFMKDLKKVKATTEAVPIGGRISIETTANGMNHFHKTWNDPNSPYKKFFFPWYCHKPYSMPNPIGPLTNEEKLLVHMAKTRYGVTMTVGQIAFRRFKISQLGIRDFMQEYPEDDISCFLMSGNPVLDRVTLMEIKSLARMPLKSMDGLNIYKPLDPSKTYCIGADCSEGLVVTPDSDFSVGFVWSSPLCSVWFFSDQPAIFFKHSDNM